MKRLLLALALAAGTIGAAHAQQVTNGYGNFSPHLSGGSAVSATTTSTSVSFSTIGVQNTELYLYNSSTSIAFATWGVGAQTATNTGTGSIALPPGSVQVFTKGNADTLAVIMSSGTGTIYAMTGLGR